MTQPPNLRFVMEDQLVDELERKADAADLAGKADVGHRHTTGDVSGLSDALSERPTSDQVDQVVQAAVAALVGSAPETLDTLSEIAAALGQDPNFATTITNLIGTKAPADHTHTLSSLGALAAAGSALTVWAGTQTAYNALPAATRNAVGFIAVITP